MAQQFQATIISATTKKRRTVKVRSAGRNHAYVGTVHAGGHQVAETEECAFIEAAFRSGIALADTI